MKRKGVNIYETSITKSFAITSRVCIFISHISIDKEFAKSIGDYIKEAGFNIYLDVDDPELQRAVREKNPHKVTACIEKGVSLSTNIICLVSQVTATSWWVPYEIGYGKKSNKQIATMPIKGTSSLPDYLQITEKISGIRSLNNYLAKLLRENGISDGLFKSAARPDGYLIESTTVTHPLKPYFEIF
ncbi:MAG: hypothetical protein JL56_07475 [Desulfotomaculum sp. BICA1-6]|nr:MAG: hypothetical protein JL56_07475 [Desulfotomaculum sp. BICA1-6]